MPRIRTLKPEHRAHRKVGQLSDRAYRLWVSMILEADDEGRLVCSPEHLRATTWPYAARFRLRNVLYDLDSLEKVGLIVRYVVDSVTYAYFPSWHDHQVINRMRPSRLPDIHGVISERSLNDHGAFTDHSRGKGREVEGKGKEVEGKGRVWITPQAPAVPNGGTPAGESWTKHLTPAASTAEPVQAIAPEQWSATVAQLAGDLKRKFAVSAAKTVAKEDETPF